jgi:hypothetical protein
MTPTKNNLSINTNGLLKRSIALQVVKWANFWSIVIFLIPVLLYVINGLKWINISTDSITTILVGANTLIATIQNQKSQIVNFYFERNNEELENGHKIQKTITEYSTDGDFKSTVS